MASSYGSSRARRTVGRLFVAVLVAASVLLSVGPTKSARAASPAAGGATSTYTVIATPNDVTLCPGQSRQVAVRVSRQVTRTVRGQAVQGRPSDVHRTRITSQALDAPIASVAPGTAQTAGLQFTGGAQGRSPHFGAWFTVTAGQVGETQIVFAAARLSNPQAVLPAGPGEDELAALGSTTPGERMDVHVKCQFKVTLSAAWTIPGEDLTHDASFVLSDVGLAPDADGKFNVDATVPNRAVRASSICGGAATVSASQAHFKGSVTPSGLLHVDVTFDPVSHTSGEACRGKSRTARRLCNHWLSMRM